MKKTFYKGIKTHNLKNIDVEIMQNQLICVAGVSGSGKSSLTFGTMAAISMEEYGKLTSEEEINQDYQIDYYENIPMAVPLKQLNFNINPRSTIATYFGLQKSLNYVISNLTKKSLNDLNFNGEGCCRECGGLGFKYFPNESIIIDWNIPLEDNPFQCWHNSYKDFYNRLLIHYCKEKNINPQKTMKQLSEAEREFILYGKGIEKHKIQFNINGKSRIKTSVYYGPMIEVALGSRNFPTISFKKYTKTGKCMLCEGSRLKLDVAKINVTKEITIGKLMTSDFISLATIIETFPQKDIFTLNALKNLKVFINKAIQLGVGHLSMARGIPSLSGGELQRLRLAQILSGNLVNLMIILDEPTTSLHPMECEMIAKLIADIRKANTLIVVEHNKEVLSLADKVLYLGPSGGLEGGYLITEKEFEKINHENEEEFFVKGKDCITIRPSSEFVNYNGNIQIHKGTVNVICGTSGCGKSIFLRECLSEQIENYDYISQRPIRSNSNSTVGTYTGLANEVKKIFAKANKEDIKIFSKSANGACKKCNGTGRINIGDYYGQPIHTICKKCNGTGFSDNTLKKTISGKNIADIFSMPLFELEKYIIFDGKGQYIINLFRKLYLEHLSLDRPLSTLSGGENQRIKLVVALQKSENAIIGLDEPVKGLGCKEINSVLHLMYEQAIMQNKTFVVAEHNIQFIRGASYITELKRDTDITTIIYNGKKSEIKKCEKSIIKNWLEKK